jgi:hypothetical protein
MAMGREGDRQEDLIVTWSEMPRSPGHVFYDRLQEVLIAGGFDLFVETACQPYYAPKLGVPSLPPGRYFRMHMVGYFEGIASERGIAWRCSDSVPALAGGGRAVDHHPGTGDSAAARANEQIEIARNPMTTRFEGGNGFGG